MVKFEFFSYLMILSYMFSGTVVLAVELRLLRRTAQDSSIFGYLATPHIVSFNCMTVNVTLRDGRVNG